MSSIQESSKKIAFYTAANEAILDVRKKMEEANETVAALGKEANYQKFNEIVNPLLKLNEAYANMLIGFQKIMQSQAEIYAKSAASEIGLKTAANKLVDEIQMVAIEAPVLNATGLDEHFEVGKHGVNFINAISDATQARYAFMAALADEYGKNATDDTKDAFRVMCGKAEEASNEFAREVMAKADACTALGMDVTKLQEAIAEASNGFNPDDAVADGVAAAKATEVEI